MPGRHRRTKLSRIQNDRCPQLDSRNYPSQALGNSKPALLNLKGSVRRKGRTENSQMWWRDLFRPKPKPATAESDPSDTIRKISHALEKLDPDRAKYIAAFAFILGRVANADLHISPEEVAEMERIVERVGQLPEEQAVLVVEIAKAQHALFGASENFVVTQEFNRIATRAQKQALLHCLFAVSSSDQAISVKEDNEIRAISRELRLDHSDFIAARSSYREHLSVLKS